MSAFEPKLYAKLNCPFSFRVVLFLAEAGLLERFTLIECDPDASEFEAQRAFLSEVTGKPASFPTVEVAPGVYRSESDALIAHYASEHQIDLATLPALDFYARGVFRSVIRLYTENRALAERLGEG